MDTGSFNNKYTLEEYKIICAYFGIVREWEVKLSYDAYINYLDGNYKKADLTIYYNTLYFEEGSFN